MGEREASLVQVFDETDLVPSGRRAIHWQTTASPDELEVEALLLLTEGLEDAPESFHDRMRIFVIREHSD